MGNKKKDSGLLPEWAEKTGEFDTAIWVERIEAARRADFAELADL